MRSATASACARSSAARELARLSEARASVETRSEQYLHHDRAAVSLQLEHRLACIRMRRGKVKRDALVDRLAAGVAEYRV